MKTDDDVSVYENALGFVESKLSQGSREKTVGYQHGTHVWSNQEILHERGDAVHIVRQYFWSSLAQRITSRPFLTWSQKAWIGYQVILGVVQAHSCGVCHGDLKTENIMLTSWGWVFLVDFLPFKPTWLPKDNPADFSIFFDTSGKRKCCIAPERFVSQSQGNALGQKEGLRPEMDVFSLGCVLAEVFSDGASIFEYADLLEFARSRKYPDGFFQGIDSRVVTLIQSMLERDPEKRPCARECVDRYVQCEGMCAEDFDRLHSICYTWCDIPADERIRLGIESFPVCVDDQAPRGLLPVPAQEGEHPRVNNNKEKEHYVDILDIDILGKNLIHDIASMLKHGHEVQEESSGMPPREGKGQEQVQQDTCVQRQSAGTVHALDHSVLYHNLTVIYCALLRSCRHFSSKIKLLYIIQQCVDVASHTDILLYVVIPHVITAATDTHGRSRTKTYALSLLPKFLSLLDGGACGEGTPATASQVVGDYVLPSISRLPHDSDLAVQSQYSCSIGSIGSISARMVYYQGAGNVNTREEYLERIRGIVERGVHDILVGPSSLPKLALLPHLGDISYGIGCQGSINDLLPALLTLFNCRDWNVRSSLYMALEHIFPVLGPRALPYILPFVDRLLTDPDIGSLLSGITLLAHLIQARLICIKDVVQINEKVMEIDRELLQVKVVRDYIVHLHKVSHTYLGPVASKAMLNPIYDTAAWKMADCTTMLQKPRTLHVGQDTLFHAEYVADSLEVYTVSVQPVHEIGTGMISRSKLEQMIDSSQRDGEGLSHGPAILLQSPSLRKRQHVEENNTKDMGSKYRPVDWMPKGIMVARIPCHSKPITEISGNLFKGSTLFITSSKDRTCKLWDTQKIEKDIQFHPRRTFIGDSGYSCVCESTHGTFVAGRDDGVLDAWDIGQNTNTISSWNCGPGGILDISCIQRRNICIVSTGAHGVLGVDVRAKDPSWTLCADPTMGIPTRVGVDIECPHYFVTGTSRGFTTVWDMRFLLPVNSWRNPSHAPIESIAITSGATIGVSSSGPVAITASGIDEISGWDIVSGSCKIVLASRGSTQDDAFVPEALKVSVMDKQKPEDPLGLARQMGASDLRSLSSKRTSVKSVLVTATGKILSGGADKCIRLWNPKDPARSYTVASARDGPSSNTSNYVSQAYMGDTKVLTEYSRKAVPPESNVVWHTGHVTSLMQLQGQKDKLLASASSNGILHVWR